MPRPRSARRTSVTDADFARTLTTAFRRVAMRFLVALLAVGLRLLSPKLSGPRCSVRVTVLLFTDNLWAMSLSDWPVWRSAKIRARPLGVRVPVPEHILAPRFWGRHRMFSAHVSVSLICV